MVTKDDWTEQLERCRGIIHRELSTMPEGTLHITRSGKYCRFYRYPGKGWNGDYLRRSDTETVHALAQKDYLQKLDKELAAVLQSHRARFTAEAELQRLTAVYDSLSPVRQSLVKPLFLSDSDYAERWRAMPYERKDRWEGDTTFTTKAGENVRSKSEKIIADLLHDRGIPYRYECALRLPDRRVFPDFTVLNPRTRRELIWEHFGLLDKSDYAESALRKLNAYMAAGYVPGIELIVTYEAAGCPLNVAMLEKIAEHYFT